MGEAQPLKAPGHRKNRIIPCFLSGMGKELSPVDISQTNPRKVIPQTDGVDLWQGNDHMLGLARSWVHPRSRREDTPHLPHQLSPALPAHALESFHLRLREFRQIITWGLISLFPPQGNLTRNADQAKECILLLPKTTCLFIKIWSLNCITGTVLTAGANLGALGARTMDIEHDKSTMTYAQSTRTHGRTRGHY